MAARAEPFMRSLLTAALLLWLASAAKWKPSADHPLLLLQLADDFDQHLLRDHIERTAPTESPAVRSVTETRICTSSDRTA